MPFYSKLTYKNCSRGDRSTEETLYMLEVESSETLYRDMVGVGGPHRLSSGPTYLHLLSEGHALLKFVTHLSTSHLPHHKPTQQQWDLYKESCALFADYYLA